MYSISLKLSMCSTYLVAQKAYNMNLEGYWMYKREGYIGAIFR